jgi:hypothetical protein
LKLSIERLEKDHHGTLYRKFLDGHDAFSKENRDFWGQLSEIHFGSIFSHDDVASKRETVADG